MLSRLLFILSATAVPVILILVQYILPDKFDVGSLPKGQSFVVTGANSGLGYASAKLLAKGGAKLVIMGCRNMTKCIAAKEKIVHQLTKDIETIGEDISNKVDFTKMLIPLELDLANRTSISVFTNAVKETLEANKMNFLDVLINNAGTMGIPQERASSGAEMHIQANHLGHFQLTLELVSSSIMKKDTGRVVSVSSLAAGFPSKIRREEILNYSIHSKNEHYSSIVSYSNSKRANLLFTHELNKRYNVVAVAAHPGYTRSNIMFGEGSWNFAPMILKKLAHHNPIGSMSIEEGALCQLRAALDPSISRNDYVGPMFGVAGRPVIIGDSLSPPFAFTRLSDDDAVELWSWSEQSLTQ